jgi:DNA-binding transcriptional LysR family regulator
MSIGPRFHISGAPRIAGLSLTDMIDLADIAVLVEAVQLGSLSAAGRRLGLTPVAASRRLAALEAEFGVRLVHRTTRALSLTPEGEAFLPHAEAMLASADEGRAAITPDSAGASGLLRIATSVPFGRKVVTPMLASFMNAHRQLRVELRLSDSMIDIAGEGIDVALRLAELRDSQLVARRLAANPRGLYASPAYLTDRGQPTTLADLGQHECLAAVGVSHWTFEQAGRTVRKAVRARFVTDSMDALLEASLGGLGIVRLSDWNVRDDVLAGRLVPVPLTDGTVPDQGIWAVSPTRQFLPGKVRIFLQALEARLHEPASRNHGAEIADPPTPSTCRTVHRASAGRTGSAA